MPGSRGVRTCMLFCEFGARSIYAHSLLGSSKPYRANRKRREKERTELPEKQCVRCVFKMIYSVAYVNIVESKDQRFVYMHVDTLCLCVTSARLRVIYNANGKNFRFTQHQTMKTEWGACSALLFPGKLTIWLFEYSLKSNFYEIENYFRTNSTEPSSRNILNSKTKHRKLR